jgi:hypothetical protein
MDLSKSYEYFKPEQDNARLHIVGCGSVGSTLAENLARCGLKNFTLWDFDRVEQHNIVNQMFRRQDVGRLKVEALKDILVEINEDCAESIQLKPAGWQGKMMSGYIFLCVDNIEIRRKIVEQHMNSTDVKAIYDFRTGLEIAQHFAADWTDREMREALLASMQFSHDEAKAEEPVTACGITLGLCPTVRIICAYGTANHINFVKGKGLKRMVVADVFNMDTLAL